MRRRRRRGDGFPVATSMLSSTLDVGICDVVRTGVDADVVCAVVGGDVSREGVGLGAGLGCVHRFSRCASVDIEPRRP
jgi:hypothetical protein